MILSLYFLALFAYFIFVLYKYGYGLKATELPWPLDRIVDGFLCLIEDALAILADQLIRVASAIAPPVELPDIKTPHGFDYAAAIGFREGLGSVPNGFRFIADPDPIKWIDGQAFIQTHQPLSRAWIRPEHYITFMEDQAKLEAISIEWFKV